MKHRISFLALITVSLGLAAYGAMTFEKEGNVRSNAEMTDPYLWPGLFTSDLYAPKRSDPDFAYAMGTRFIANVSKKQLKDAKIVEDIIPSSASWHHFPINGLSIARVDNVEMKELGDSPELNEAQKALLQSMEYADDIQVLAHCYGSKEQADRDKCQLAYYISVVPEQQAQYPAGTEAFVGYIVDQSEKIVAHTEKELLEPGRIRFTVTSEGKIGKVELDSTSGYPEVDEEMIKIVKKVPGKWTPAQDAQGNKVAQELTFFFGSIGC